MLNFSPRIHQILKKHSFLSVEEYADKKKITPWYVRKLCRDGKINGHRLDKTWFIEVTN